MNPFKSIVIVRHDWKAWGVNSGTETQWFELPDMAIAYAKVNPNGWLFSRDSQTAKAVAHFNLKSEAK